jgi:hypothetical protein
MRGAAADLGCTWRGRYSPVPAGTKLEMVLVRIGIREELVQ